MSSVTYLQLLRRNRPFRRLWTGQAISELGNWFNFIAALGLVRSLSGSAWAASAVIICNLLPFCVLGPLAGALADRFGRRRLMLIADLARAVVALGFLFVREADHLWLVYACCASLSALAALFEASRNAAMPNLTRGGELLPANALFHASRFFQLTVGAVLGGLAASSFGYDTAFLLNSASFVVSAISILGVPAAALQSDENHAPGAASLRGLLSDVRAGVQFVRSEPLVLAVLGLNFGWATGGGMMTVINDRFGGLVFADQVGGADTAVSILYGAAGLGLALGMFAARRIGLAFAARDRLGAFMGWAIVASGLVFALCGTVTTVWVMGALYVVNRLILSAEYAVQETILLTSVPDSLRGKVFLLDRSIELATLTVSAAVAAALFSVLPLRSVPVISGLLMASPGLLWLAALNQGRFVVSPQRLTSSG